MRHAYGPQIRGRFRRLQRPILAGGWFVQGPTTIEPRLWDMYVAHACKAAMYAYLTFSGSPYGRAHICASNVRHACTPKSAHWPLPRARPKRGTRSAQQKRTQRLDVALAQPWSARQKDLRPSTSLGATLVRDRISRKTSFRERRQSCPVTRLTRARTSRRVASCHGTRLQLCASPSHQLISRQNARSDHGPQALPRWSSAFPSLQASPAIDCSPAPHRPTAPYGQR